MEKQRRTALKRLLGTIGGLVGATVVSKAERVKTATGSVRHEAGTAGMPEAEYQQDVPLFSGNTKYNGLVFIAGKGAHVEPFEIKAHTEIVLKELEKELIAAGSSMQKVLKVTVFLNDIADYQGMNEVYKGRFGSKPPVRTTVAVAKGGVPGNSLVEMDCIAYV
ncbi:RidA family protein [Flavitalea sp. BT771]|uniref:RidA family protein n=1 Tax=Flavitalea sp. BT771 TaxID=3063329 RepID=UPI0026E12093|nr:RidA family protein [Flavitalea sp. BT771]MDO6434854.1 RidA family protein [Flavitalea sp. BT771]MDV6223754.1 RidA family protein [Flavitalea sp. BT771]